MLFVVKNLSLNRCTLIILHRGAKAEKQRQTTVKMLCRDCKSEKREHRNKLFVQHEVAMNDLSYNLRNVKKKSVS